MTERLSRDGGRLIYTTDVESTDFYTNTSFAFVSPICTVHASVDPISGVETLHSPR